MTGRQPDKGYNRSDPDAAVAMTRCLSCDGGIRVLLLLWRWSEENKIPKEWKQVACTNRL
jgi:hypothetical protein